MRARIPFLAKQLVFSTRMTHGKYIIIAHVIVNYVTRSQAPLSTRLALSCIRYFMQMKDVFRVIPGVFGIITLANRKIFGVGTFTVLGRKNS